MFREYHTLQVSEDVVTIRQVLQHTQIPVVVGIGIGFIASCADALQGVNDHQDSVRICTEKSLDLLYQTAVQFL